MLKIIIIIIIIYIVLFLNLALFQIQEAERNGVVKCKYGEDTTRFYLKNTTTLEELLGMVEGEWGEGKGLKFQEEDGDWSRMRTNDDMVEVWNRTKMGVVSLIVFSTQQNQVSFF